jgi:hypothetical protein
MRDHLGLVLVLVLVLRGAVDSSRRCWASARARTSARTVSGATEP